MQYETDPTTRERKTTNFKIKALSFKAANTLCMQILFLANSSDFLLLGCYANK